MVIVTAPLSVITAKCAGVLLEIPLEIEIPADEDPTGAPNPSRESLTY